MNDNPPLLRARERLDELRALPAEERRSAALGELECVLEAYLKQAEQFEKVMAISDQYQASLREATTRLERMARVDSLTGLANRRDMVEHLDVELVRARRQQRPFSVILFDIDDFKKVNDHFGHQSGDQTLVAVAALVKTLLRRTDLCARWGGEEFLILCPETAGEEALVVAEKCRAEVAALVVSSTGGPISVTLSGGVGVFRNESAGWEPVVARADAGLYRAKVAGKNRIAGLE